jgi:outer membrane receptor protein involved in Fe transport
MTASLLVAAALLLVVPTAFAQTTGRIDGRVIDKNGDPLPGVTVTASSNALQGTRTAVTEADGRFRLLALAPGSYSIKAELDGFNLLESSDIGVGLDRTVSLELEMTPVFGEVVTITTEAPVIDTTSTTSGASFNEELIADLPTTRTFNGLAFNAPGVVAAGNPGGGAAEPSIGGASAAENRYVVDGLDTTVPAFGTIGSTLAFEFIQEVEVKTGGYEAEYGGALGGMLNVITKSGSNELAGDVFGYYNDDSLQEESPPLVQTGKALGYTEYDFGADLGGKLIQDRLWYFVAVNPSYLDDKVESRTGVQFTTEVDRIYYAGKLTWQANPNNQIVLSAFGDPTERTNDARSLNSGGLVAHDIDDGAMSFGLTYNGTLGANFLLEASAGRYDQEEKQVPLNPDRPFYSVRTTAASNVINFARNSGCFDATDTIINLTVFNPGCVGGTFFQENGDRQRDDAKLSGTLFATTGPLDHEFKAGVSYRDVTYTDISHYPGQNRSVRTDETGYVFAPNGLGGQQIRLYNGFYLLYDYDQNSEGNTEETALFLQDQVRVGDYVTLNLGVRADQFESRGNNRFNLPNRALDFGFSDTVAPRIGFTADVTRNGRSKLFGHYGKFYESVPLDINVRAFSNETYNLHYFYYPSDGSLPGHANQGEWFYTYFLGAGTAVDPNIEPMYSEEMVAGFEYEIAPGIAAGLKVVDRSLGNVVEDISVDNGHTYFITNPGGTYTANPVTGEPIDEDHDGVAETVVFPEAERNYRAYEFTLNKRFSNNWQAFFSYVNSENEGNYGGLFRQDNGQLDPNITSLFDLPSLLIGAYGLLPNDREHQFKLYGSYVWPFKLVTGFNASWLSGTPISKLGAHNVYGNSERFIVPRGSAGRTDDLWSIDAHIEYPVSFGDALDLRIIADVFNITDEAKATAVDQNWTFARAARTTDPNECGGPGTGAGTSCPNGNPLFGTPTQYQTPRTIRLGLKASF